MAICSFYKYKNISKNDRDFWEDYKKSGKSLFFAFMGNRNWDWKVVCILAKRKIVAMFCLELTEVLLSKTLPITF